MSSPQMTRMFGRSVGIAGLRVSRGRATALRSSQPAGRNVPSPREDDGLVTRCANGAMRSPVHDRPIGGHVHDGPFVLGGGREKLLRAAAEDGVAVIGVFAIAVRVPMTSSRFRCRLPPAHASMPGRRRCSRRPGSVAARRAGGSSSVSAGRRRRPGPRRSSEVRGRPREIRLTYRMTGGTRLPHPFRMTTAPPGSASVAAASRTGSRRRRASCRCPVTDLSRRSRR